MGKKRSRTSEDEPQKKSPKKTDDGDDSAEEVRMFDGRRET